MTQTVTDTIQIDDNGVSLDFNNQLIEKGTGNGNYGVTNRYETTDITVKNCRIQGAWSLGIYITISTNANIVNNTVDGSYTGISFYFCQDCQFLNNSIKNGINAGFKFVGASRSTVFTRRPEKFISNTVRNTPYGWQWGTFYTFLGCVDEFAGNTVDGKEVRYLCQSANAIVADTDAISTIGVFYSDNVTISNVLFPGGVYQSIFMQFVTNFLIEGIDTGERETGVGIEINDGAFANPRTSTNVTIRGNRLHDAGWGVLMTGFQSTHIVIENNQISTISGVRLQGDQHIVTNNDMGGTLTGIGLYGLSYGGNTITNNKIHDYKVGMRLSRQGGNGSLYRDNIISRNIANVDFLVQPQKPLTDYDTDFDASNAVDGKTVRILKNPQGETVTGDWALVLVLGGDGVTIERVTTGNNSEDSIALVQTNNSTIRDSTIGGAHRGIVVAGGHNNQIMNNTFTPPDPQTQDAYGGGIWLESTSENRASENTIPEYWNGIYLDNQYADSAGNILEGNVITGGEKGIYLRVSSLEWTLQNNNILNSDISTNETGVTLNSYGDGRATNNLVSGNQIHSRGYGLYLINTSKNIITNNLFFGHTAPGYGDIYSYFYGYIDTDDKVFGNDFFSGIYSNDRT